MSVKMLIFFFIGLMVYPAQNLPTTPAFVFHDRASWGARAATDTRPLATPAGYAVIHHTYIPGACRTDAACSQAMRSMQRYHMDTLDWGDIGYHFCIGSDGAVYEGRGWRMEGIHAAGLNNVSVGICLIGDWRKLIAIDNDPFSPVAFTAERPPQSMLVSAQALIASGVAQGVFSADYKLIGHGQASPTECPGTQLSDEIEKWDHYSPGSLYSPTKLT